MSNTIGSRHHAREQLDRAIGQAFVELAHCRHAFANLLAQARAKSSLLRITGDGGQQLLALEGLRNIARNHDEFVAWPSTWSGGEASVYTLIHQLACHLFGQYQVPRGFGLVWFGGAAKPQRRERQWFIEHARGRAFREITDLPIRLTRKMERILLHSPHHLPLRAAIRRAEVLGLGGSPELVEAILATPLATDLEHAEFWRSAIQFFIQHADELAPIGPIGSIVEMLYVVRIRTTEVVTPTGVVVTPPPEPEFSLAGRTPVSLERELARVRALLYPWTGGSQPLELHWPSSGLVGLDYVDDLGRWAMIELLDAHELRREGQTMQHCVAGYWRKCARGHASIWSLRLGDESRCTVEVNPKTGTIVQIRGVRNQRVEGRQRAILEAWAAHAGLTIATLAWGP